MRSLKYQRDQNSILRQRVMKGRGSKRKPPDPVQSKLE